ncbi:MAG: ligB, partial [Acidobacteria bacterium]|nr:ligB [Acidobacteriota bacterium]
MQLQEVADTSLRVTGTSSRLGKIDILAALLRRLSQPEIPVALAYLTGTLPQGRIGIGHSAITQSRPSRPAPEPALGLLEVHEAFDRLAAITGAGSSRDRAAVLRGLLARATEAEQAFLVRLL